MFNLSNQNFRKALLLIFLVELLSLDAFLVPNFMPIIFWIILGLFFITSLYKLEYALWILLIELFIGSKGYLFFYDFHGIRVSVRIALFLVFMAVWLARTLMATNKKRIDTNYELNEFNFKRLFQRKRKLITYYLLLITLISWGLVWGIIRGNEFNNIFFDFNAWLFFALFLPFLDLITKERVGKIMQIFTAAIIWISVKTILILYFFSHQFFNIGPLYKWIRDSGVGEITMMSGNFYRIFFQSQIYVLIGFFLIFIMLISIRMNANRDSNFKKPMKLFFCFFVLLFSCILISFSRSYWVGLVGGLGILFLILKFKAKFSWSRIFKLAGALLLFFAGSIGIIFGVINLPPRVSGGESFASLIEERITTTTGEAGGSSRINLLKPLLKANLKHPIIGSGFGTTVTYKSNDPRIRTNLNPEGWYTTYAFEWGFLDIWLKIGLIGLGVYLLFVYQIWCRGWQIIKSQAPIEQRTLVFGMLLGLAVLLVTNVFSPYLNHPLGIGYVLLCGAIFVVL